MTRLTKDKIFITIIIAVQLLTYYYVVDLLNSYFK